jgi:ATP-binding cassette, subfamily A (ABC1), member 3
MKCLGSSLFLKKRFGAGYKLTMVKDSKTENKLIKPYIESKLGVQAELISEISSEIAFGVPDTAEGRFTDFFASFDQDMTALGILSYGISITTLEEVFLHINKEFGMDLKKATGEVAEAEKTTAQELSVIEPASVQVVESDPF